MNIGINDAGDWDILNGELVFVRDQEELRQFLIQKMRTFLGEWFLDLRVGVPYFEEIFKKRPDPAIIESIFVNEILATPGIVDLVEFDLNLDNATRSLSVDFRATTLDGEINFSEVLT